MEIEIYVYFKPEISELQNISGITLSKTGWGEVYCLLGDFSSKLPKNSIKYVDRVKAICYFQAKPAREKGEYRIGKTVGELSVVKDNSYQSGSYCLTIIGGDQESVKKLYESVRIGKVRPQKCYENEQCTEDTRSVLALIRRPKSIFWKRYLLPGGFSREAIRIVKETESSLAT